MTLRTGVAELIGDMRRAVGTIEIRLVAGPARRGRTSVVSIGMALTAGHCDVCARQWERRRSMIEGRRLPGCGVVTLRTGMTKLVRRVRRIVR